MLYRLFIFVALLICTLFPTWGAEESPVYPRPQKIDISDQLTSIKSISVRTRGARSRGSYWDRVPKISGAYCLHITPGKLAVYAHDEVGVFYAKQTLCQLLRGVPEARETHRDPFIDKTLEEVARKGKVPTGTIIDWPDLPYRGVVEGYYGIPWSTEARMAQFEFYGRNKLNTFIYAPKDDPYHHGGGCYRPYPADKAAELRKMVAHARKNHVKFFWAIHPANTVNWDNANGTPQLDQLCAKLQQLYDLGVRDFGVFVDDSSGEIGKASRQVQLCRYIQENFIRKHPEANQELIMCPTGYNRGWTNENFLTEIGEGLPKDIFMMWTGNSVVHDIKLEGQQWVNKFLKSPTFIWWNWPCNDFRRDRLSMGRTYGLGTEPEMKKQMSGFVANPMEHAEANKVALFGVADYTWNITRFDSVSTWKAGIARLYPEYQEEMQIFCNHNSNLLPNGHGYYREESVELAPQLKALRETFAQGLPTEQSMSAMRKIFKDIRKAGKKLRTAEGSAAALAKEIQPWLSQFEMLGAAGDRLLDSCSRKEKKPLETFLKAAAVLSEMKQTTRPQWNGNGVKEVQGVTVGTEHIMPLIDAVLKYKNDELYQEIAQSKADKVASVIPTVTSSIRGINLTINDTETEIAINRVMEFYPLPAGGTIELTIPTGVPAREILIDLENGSIADWGTVEIHALNGRKGRPAPEVRGSTLSLTGKALPKSGVRKLILINKSRSTQQVKIRDFKVLLPEKGQWVDARWLSDADISTSIDCGHSNIKLRVAVPKPTTRRVILVGTAEAKVTPGKNGKRVGPILYHSIPKGTRTIEISIKKEEGARLNEIIFR